MVHLFTSLTQFCMLQNRESVLERGFELYNSVPSVNIWYRTECRSMLSDRGCVYRMKRAGSSTEPRGTPYNKERWLRFTTQWAMQARIMQTLQRPLSVIVTQFSSRWYLCARKSPYALHPVSQTFPQRCPLNSSNVRLIDDGPLSSF